MLGCDQVVVLQIAILVDGEYLAFHTHIDYTIGANRQRDNILIQWFKINGADILTKLP